MMLNGQMTTILVDGANLTSDSNTITIEDGYEMFDQTAYVSEVQCFVPTVRRAAIHHRGFLNPSENGSHPALRQVNVQGVVSIVADDSPSALTYSFLSRQTRYQTLPQFGGAIPFSAQFQAHGAVGWGVALANGVTFNTTTAGNIVDGNQASSEGIAFLHILQAAASDTYTITLEGSASGSFTGEESALATFTLNGSALGSETLTISSAIPRYIRWVASRSGAAGDTIKITINLVRR